MIYKNRKRIVLIGAGGHCKVVIDALRRNDDFEIYGVVDNNQRITKISGIQNIGKDSNLPDIYRSGCVNAFITVGSIGDPGNRIELHRRLKEIGFRFPVIVHVNSTIAEDVKLGEGVFVGPGTVIGPGVEIGRHAIINTMASIDHDCTIGGFSHIAPGVVLSGGVEIGEKSHIGTGSSIIEYKKIGVSCLIGAGSVVVSDIPSNSKAFGNPCKVVGRNNG